MALMEVERHRLHGEIVFTETDIEEQVGRMALELAERDARIKNADPLYIKMMKGGGPFGDSLQAAMARIGYYPEFAEHTISTYTDENQAREPRLVVPLPPEISFARRPIRNVDDIHDSGKTDMFARSLFVGEQLAPEDQALEAIMVSLINRIIPKEIQPEVFGFETKRTDWFVGGGLDDPRLKGLSHDCGRYLPYIAVALSDADIAALMEEAERITEEAVLL